MKKMLQLLKEGEEIKLGSFATIFRYDDGTICARLASSLTGPNEKATWAGLKKILAWIDNPNH